jgi:nuclear cap-binding protein subunit 1
VEQPLKIPFVAAIILVANPQKPAISKEILTRAVDAMNLYLKAGAWREVKLVLRLLACLQGLLEGEGVFPILEKLFDRAGDLQSASSEDVSLPV